jgi:hypothetical protein
MSKDKKTSNLEHGKLPTPWIQLPTAKLDKNSELTLAGIPEKQVFSQELILRLTDRIKEI